jgi:hypothetical protein
MRYTLRTALGGHKQILQPVEGAEPVVIASFAPGPQQRHMLSLIQEGMLSAGDTMYDETRKRWVIGDVGQLTRDVAEGWQACPDCGPDTSCGKSTCCRGGQ